MCSIIINNNYAILFLVFFFFIDTSDIYIYTYLFVDEVINTTKIYTRNFEILNLNLNESVQSNNIGIDS
jgi:hypothetical protein